MNQWQATCKAHEDSIVNERWRSQAIAPKRDRVQDALGAVWTLAREWLVPPLLTVAFLAGLMGVIYALVTLAITTNETRGLYLRFEVLAVTADPIPASTYTVRLRERTHGSTFQLVVSHATAERLKDAQAAGGVAEAMLEDVAPPSGGMRFF